MKMRLVQAFVAGAILAVVALLLVEEVFPATSRWVLAPILFAGFMGIALLLRSRVPSEPGSGPHP